MNKIFEDRFLFEEGAYVTDEKRNMDQKDIHILPVPVVVGSYYHFPVSLQQVHVPHHTGPVPEHHYIVEHRDLSALQLFLIEREQTVIFRKLAEQRLHPGIAVGKFRKALLQTHVPSAEFIVPIGADGILLKNSLMLSPAFLPAVEYGPGE